MNIGTCVPWSADRKLLLHRNFGDKAYTFIISNQFQWNIDLRIRIFYQGNVLKIVGHFVYNQIVLIRLKHFMISNIPWRYG